MSSADITPRETLTLVSADAAPKVGLAIGPRWGHRWTYTLTVRRPPILGGDPTPVPVGASAIVEVSNDGVGWILYGTLDAPTANDVAVDTTGIEGNTAWDLHRATITNLIGPAGTLAFVNAARVGD